MHSCKIYHYHIYKYINIYILQDVMHNCIIYHYHIVIIECSDPLKTVTV